MAMDSLRRRQILQTVVGGSAIGFAGCGSVFNSRESDTKTNTPISIPDEASFGFNYSAGSLKITHTGGDAIPAEHLFIRSSEGTKVRWPNLGSTAVSASDTVSSGDTAMLGASVLNWPNAVNHSERIHIVFQEGVESVTTLATFRPKETETPAPNNSPFVDDFDYKSDALSENGWKVSNGFKTTSDGYLTPNPGLVNTWISRPVPNAGEYTISGVSNKATYGLRIALTTDVPSGTNYQGYQIIIQGSNADHDDSDSLPGEVIFTRRDGSSGEVLIDSDYQHAGDFHDYEIERSADGWMNVRIDNELYGFASDNKIKEINHIGFRFDAGDQYIDTVEFDQPECQGVLSNE